jgi:hypothetical protein
MPRRPTPHIKVYGTAEELSALKAKAESANLSDSSYLRAAGLNHPIRSRLDLDGIDKLVEVHGNLGRVAGLLKLWLATKRGVGAHPKAIESMMNYSRKLQKMCHEIMGGMIR